MFVKDFDWKVELKMGYFKRWDCHSITIFVKQKFVICVQIDSLDRW